MSNRDVGLDDICAGLEEKRDRLRQVADCTDVAIKALRDLQAAYGGAMLPATAEALPAITVAPTPPAAPAPASAPKRHVRVHANRPTRGVCGYDSCGKKFVVSGTGRLKRFCGPVHARLARKASAAAAAPSADVAVDELLSTAPPIPESAGGMKARIAQALKSTDDIAPPRSRFLDTVRGRNDDAARRSRR
jgi:hypothetical protein